LGDDLRLLEPAPSSGLHMTQTLSKRLGVK